MILDILNQVGHLQISVNNSFFMDIFKTLKILNIQFLFARFQVNKDNLRAVFGKTLVLSSEYLMN